MSTGSPGPSHCSRHGRTSRSPASGALLGTQCPGGTGAAARGDNDAAARAVLLDKANRLDGEQLLAEWGRRRLEDFGEKVAQHARDELNGRGVWPPGPRRQPKLLYSLARNDTQEVLVALVPAKQPWEIPAVIGYGGWNYYPTPEDHVAILRYWNDRYGAELVAMTGTTV